MPKRDGGTDAIDRSLQEISYKDRDGYPYIIHPLMDGVPRVDPQMLREWVAWAEQQDAIKDATVLLAPEAMGIPLAVALSLETGIPYVVARKREYGLDGEMVAYCETGYGSDCIYINDVTPEDKVLIIEDVISTGGTLNALIETLRSMHAQVTGVLCAISKGDGAETVRTASEVPVACLRRIDFQENGTITVE